jgi:hypothetical protein
LQVRPPQTPDFTGAVGTALEIRDLQLQQQALQLEQQLQLQREAAESQTPQPHPQTHAEIGPGAQQPMETGPILTHGLTNCRLWGGMPDMTEKSLYLIALQEGIGQGAARAALLSTGNMEAAKKSYDSVFDEYSPHSNDRSKIAKAIDGFCGSLENQAVPIINVVRLVVMWLNGADSGEIEKESVRIRNQAAK